MPDVVYGFLDELENPNASDAEESDAGEEAPAPAGRQSPRRASPRARRQQRRRARSGGLGFFPPEFSLEVTGAALSGEEMAENGGGR